MLNKKTLTVMFSLALAGSMAVPTFAAAALPAQSSSVDWKPALSQSVSTHAASQPLTAGETYLTRGELILALYEAEGKPVVNFAMDYSDVASDAPYAEAIRWASSEGIASGYDDGRFGPDDGVTREQMAVILYQYEQSNGQGFTGAWAFPLDYADADGISEYAYEAVCWVTMKEIMGDVGDNRFAPNDPVTQSEADLLFQGYFDKTQSTELANPFVSCQTMSDAAQVAGFSMELPSFLSPSSIRAVEGSMIEVLSERDYGQIMLRKGLGTEDISGDYNCYPQTSTEELNGCAVTLNGENDKIMTAVWSQDGYTYAVRAAAGLDRDEMYSIVSGLK